MQYFVTRIINAARIHEEINQPAATCRSVIHSVIDGEYAHIPSFFEPELIGAGGILDNEFGPGNLQRIDDDLDQYWTLMGSQVTVSVVAKYADFTQNFGFIGAGNIFTSLLNVPYINA